MIAVEQQAKERLERLSALRKIKPVDMSTLSQQVSDKDEPSLSMYIITRFRTDILYNSHHVHALDNSTSHIQQISIKDFSFNILVTLLFILSIYYKNVFIEFIFTLTHIVIC